MARAGAVDTLRFALSRLDGALHEPCSFGTRSSARTSATCSPWALRSLPREAAPRVPHVAHLPSYRQNLLHGHWGLLAVAAGDLAAELRVVLVELLQVLLAHEVQAAALGPQLDDLVGRGLDVGSILFEAHRLVICVPHKGFLQIQRQ